MTDWNEVLARLNRVSVERALDEENERRLLEERAQELASTREEEDVVTVRVLTFAVGSDRFGLQLGNTREIARLSDYTPVPGTPPRLLGLFNLRGTILPLFDLRLLLGPNATTQTVETTREDDRVSPGAPRRRRDDTVRRAGVPAMSVRRDTLAIVLGRDVAEFGLAVDSVGMIVTLREGDLLHSTLTGGAETRLIQALTTDGLLLLDSEMLLQDPRLQLRGVPTP